MATEHRDMTGAQLHEPKGASTATADQVYISNGSGSGVWTSLSSLIPSNTVEQGVYDYNDLLTATTPIALTVAGTQYELTNDGLGPNTNTTYSLAGLDDIWDTTTNRFTFNDGSKLSLGDTVDIRFDIDVVTTSVNTEISLSIEMAEGGTPYQLSIVPPTNFKVAGTHKLVGVLSIYMGDTNTLNNPARVLASADDTGATVRVNGWYVRPLHTV